MTTLAEIREEVRRSKPLSDYEAVDVLWVALVKAANMQAGKGEHERMAALIATLPKAQLTAILNSEGVNRLLDLDPPLETVLANQHEVQYPDKTAALMQDHSTRVYRHCALNNARQITSGQTQPHSAR